LIRSEDAARLAARIWTAAATAQMAGLNVNRLPRRMRARRPLDANHGISEYLPS